MESNRGDRYSLRSHGPVQDILTSDSRVLRGIRFLLTTPLWVQTNDHYRQTRPFGRYHFWLGSRKPCRRSDLRHPWVALDRLDPVLPLSPGRAERHGFEYYRHGTLSLYAALDVQTGKVQGKTAKRHTSDEFVAFLDQVVASAPAAREIHIVLDNLSAHKTPTVAEFLERNPRVRLHFTPTYSSWLNQVEIRFAKIQRDVIARGVFTSVADLSRKLMKYLRTYAKSARPFRWTYTDPSCRIK
jgi:transposase